MAKIEIPDAHLRHFEVFYNNRLLELETEENEIREVLSQIKSEIGHKLNGVSKYNSKSSWYVKILFLINLHHAALTTKQIVDEIINDYEPKYKARRSKIVSVISGVLSAKSKIGLLTKDKNEAGENIYGIPKNEKSPEFQTTLEQR